MDIGDAAGWAAFVIAAISLEVSRRASKTANRASERQAEAAEAALAMQEQEAQERREANAPRPELVIDYYRGDTWMLRNIGTAEATNIVVHNAPALSRVPENLTLAPGEGEPLLIAGSMQEPLPASLTVEWDNSEPEHLPVPAKPPKR